MMKDEPWEEEDNCQQANDEGEEDGGESRSVRQNGGGEED
jgi:hypothetical protein